MHFVLTFLGYGTTTTRKKIEYVTKIRDEKLKVVSNFDIANI